MGRICPQCHKHKFSIFNVMLSADTSGGQERPFECPHCGAMFNLDRKSSIWINVITIAAFVVPLALIVSVAVMLSLTPNTFKTVFTMYFIIVICLVFLTRVVATEKLGKIVKYESKHKDNRTKIELSQVLNELQWLIGAKTFIVLFDSDDKGYISVYYRKGHFVVELSFTTKVLERLEPKFKSALAKVGAQVKTVHGKGMNAVEGDLGGNMNDIANKISAIMCEIFNMKPDVEIFVMRDV